MKVDQDFSAAIFNADFEQAARLLAEGADINKVTTTMEPDERGIYEDTTTYLIEAALRGWVETVRFLLANGADPNIAGKFAGRTALLAAATSGHADVVDLLLRHGADFFRGRPSRQAERDGVRHLQRECRDCPQSFGGWSPAHFPSSQFQPRGRSRSAGDCPAADRTWIQYQQKKMTG